MDSLVLIACPGRPLAQVLQEQLRANSANNAILPQAEAAISSLQNSQKVDTRKLDPALAPLFSQAVQPFLIDLFQYDPVGLIRKIECPVLILQGKRDLQVSVGDAVALGRSAGAAVVSLMPAVNHLLKPVPKATRDANIETYSNPELPITPLAVDAISTFLSARPVASVCD